MASLPLLGNPWAPRVGRDADPPCQVQPAQVAEEELQVVRVALLHQGHHGAAGFEASLQDGLWGTQLHWALPVPTYPQD